jgi:hypothetical protein
MSHGLAAHRDTVELCSMSHALPHAPPLQTNSKPLLDTRSSETTLALASFHTLCAAKVLPTLVHVVKYKLQLQHAARRKHSQQATLSLPTQQQ